MEQVIGLMKKYSTEELYSDKIYFKKHTYNHLINWDWIDYVWLIFD